MAALNRLSQRIKENFQESTRDLNLLPGTSTSSTAAYFDASDDRIKEISKLLESRHEKERLEGMKRIIAGISKGRDMEPFFAQVVKNVVAPSIEIRKLVYIYLLRFASTNSDLLLLSINTFQKDLSDPSPLIRSMSLRVLTSIRVTVIQGIVMLGLKKLVNDRNPWVRKTVAGGLAKVYEVDSSSLPSLLPLLQTLLSSQSPLTLGATLTAFSEICPDRLDLLHPYYRHICRLLVDADEWGQTVAVAVLTRYCRAMLERPHQAPRPTDHDSEDEFEGVDIDLAMFLDCAKPLFQSRNPAVVLAVAKAYYSLAPTEHRKVGQGLLVTPLLRLARNGSPEVAALTWDAISAMAEQRPHLFRPKITEAFIYLADPEAVRLAKLRAMSALVTPDSADMVLKEYKHYIKFTAGGLASAAVRAIAQAIQVAPNVRPAGLAILTRLLRSPRDDLVAESVISLKSVILSVSSSNDLDPQMLVARLAKQVSSIQNANARARKAETLMGLAGKVYRAGCRMYCVRPSKALLKRRVYFFVAVRAYLQSTVTKLQILALAARIAVLAQATAQLTMLLQCLFSLSRYDRSYDVRDRSRLLASLLRGLAADQPEEQGEDVGGVVLRREQVKVVISRQKQNAGEVQASADFEVGSMSRTLHRRLVGYESLADWTDDPTDSTLRDSELDRPKQAIPSAISYNPTSQPSIAPVPVHLSSSAISLDRSSPAFASSPAGSAPVAKSRFQDLDAFLDSETEDEDADDSVDSQPSAYVRPTALQRNRSAHGDLSSDESVSNVEEETSKDDSGSE